MDFSRFSAFLTLAISVLFVSGNNVAELLPEVEKMCVDGQLETASVRRRPGVPVQKYRLPVCSEELKFLAGAILLLIDNISVLKRY